MRGQALSGERRRVTAVSIGIVVLIAVAVGVTIWRYQDALARSAVATDAYHDAALTSGLTRTFWHEREAMNEYLVSPGPTLRAEVDGLQREFSVTSATLAVAESGAESALRARAATAA
jgi:hypothetical protein